MNIEGPSNNLITDSESYNVSLLQRDSVPGMPNPKKLIKECKWILYTMFLYIFFLEGIALTVGSTLYQIKKGKNLQYDDIFGLIMGICQVVVFWAGHRVRREFDADEQERFATFLKVFIEFFVVVIILALITFITRGEFTFGKLTLEEIIMIAMVGHALMFFIFYKRAKRLEEYIKKHGVNRDYLMSKSISTNSP